jgi:hypothetical protein
MSVLKTAYATPSRVAAVYRFLLAQVRATVSKDTVQAVLSPTTLPDVDTQDMVGGAIQESIKMGLVHEEDGRLSLHPDLPNAARDRKHGVARLPLTITDLILRGHAENHDLARLIAWYLAQDVTSAPGDRDSVSSALGEQVGSDKLELTNDARFGQFKYWICFLGFAWMHAREGREWIVPDPTQQLRWRLPELFATDAKPSSAQVEVRMSPAQVERRLAEICPVFEGGWLRKEVEDQIGHRPDRTFSSATAHAWLRLDEEKMVQVERRSADAEVYQFPDGGAVIRCSALIRKNGGNR